MFSVVLPVWNKEHTVRRTVERALAQTFQAFELIVVDDGSTDGGPEALAGMADPRIRMVRQANAGPGPARNRGIAEARHDWVAFLDADDLWLPDHLAELDRIRGTFPAAGLIGTGFLTSDRRGRFTVPRAGDEERIEHACFFDLVGRGEMPLHTSSAAAPTALLRKLGGFGDFPRGEDSELWARIALQYPVARSTRTTAIYMRGTGGITETITRQWVAGVPQRTADVSPAVALVLERLPQVDSPATRAAIECFVERYLGWAICSAVATGDAEALRALPRLYRRPPPPQHRRLLAAARLPGPLAIAACRALLAAEAARRRLSGRAAPSSTIGRAREVPPPSRSVV